MADNCLNKHCECEKVEPRPENCAKLLELNDLKIRPAMRKISTSEWCNLQEAIRQAFYGVWCVIKNIVGFLCYILRKLECLEEKVDKICAVAKCQNDMLSDIAEQMKNTMLDNISFTMQAEGSSGTDEGATTYTRIDTTKDGSFTLRWNMIAYGREQGVGTLSGKIVHINTLNDDGSINSHISKIQFNNIEYNGYGEKFNTQANFAIKTFDGGEHYSHSYDVGSDWSEKVPDMKIGKDFKFLPKQSTKVNLFKTLDTWVNVSTNGNIVATYANNNSTPTQSAPCEITCDKC